MDIPPVIAPLSQQVAALREGVGARLLHAEVLALRGRDRATWLNGMVTQDVRAVPPGRGVYAAIVGLKGKLLADAWIHGRDDELLVVLPRGRADEVLEHFDRYIVMEDVHVARREAEVLTLQGPKAEALATYYTPAARADHLLRGGIDVVLDDAVAAREARLRDDVAAGTVTMVASEAWEVARLEAGVAAFGVDFDATNFVQEAAITRRAVSFQKGCYLGQEVVCRLEMRGHVQKQIVAMVLVGDAPPAGSVVLSEGRDVGHVTSSAPSTTLPGRAVALAMVRHAVAEAMKPVSIGGVEATLTLRPVP